MSEPNIRILYIEDDAGLAKLLERRLKRHNIDMEWAPEGNSGLEKMRHISFDVVAIDYEMPGLNGLAVLERMRSLDHFPPAIMVSGAGDMDTAIAALKMGAADYVVKTVDGSYIDLLPRTIERVLEKERLRAEAALARKQAEEEQRVAAAVFQASAEPMVITDTKLHIERCNPAFEAMVGRGRGEILGRTLSEFACDRHDQAFFAALYSELQAKKQWRGTVWNDRDESTQMAQQVAVSAIVDEFGRVEHYVAVYIDVTEQVRREDATRHQALHDGLTGLPNRVLLLDRLNQAIEAAKRDRSGFAVLFVDLDGFKPINDGYGHGTGDLLLKEIAQRLQKRCRDSDTVARYGGDEFVVVLRNSSESAAVKAMAGQLIEQIAAPVQIDGVSHRVGASIGIALYSGGSAKAETLLKHADEAMYQAKRIGKGQCWLYVADQTA